jgi:MSHA biogenesis protein MshI
LVWWNQRNFASARVGLEVLPDGLAVACSTGAITDATTTAIALLPCTSDQRESVLSEFVSQQRLQNAPCNLVLSPGDYQLLLVEAPQVPDEEMRAAVRWRLKDLVNIPLEQAIVDVFNLPTDATRSGKRMIFVAVTELLKVQKLLGLVTAGGLRLSVIDIAEMALRNLTLLLPPAETEGRGVVVVRVQGGGGSLGLYRDGNLYLSRQFELNYGGGLLDELPEEDLVLEIQRSIDYSERQMGQAPPSAIYICGDNIGDDKVTDGIKAGLAAPVRVLPVQALPRINIGDQNNHILQSCAGAIGGAMRTGGWA